MRYPPTMRIVFLSLVLLACSTARPQPAAPGDDPAVEQDPKPSNSKGPYPSCEGFAEAEAARRERHQGPCPFCPCACTPERGVFCAPCAQCESPPPPAPP